ncbi:vWA domain-containing protein [Micromonospora zamorensis]|uniref:vWA domain-containing protein n=1 Tax=Micromonospora zamorensis TaxID=709883 RepID=UPI0033B8755D
MPDQGIILPFYLVVDVSWSMQQSGKLDAARNILPGVADALAKNPILNDKVRFSLIDFSDDATVLVPLCDLSQQNTLPSLELRGGTSYGAAFRLLRQQLESDVTQLRSDGYRVHRPAVFFISDGEPTDDWKAAFVALTEYDKETGTGFRWYPVFVPCGVDAADRDVLRLLVHPPRKSKLYMMKSGVDAAAAIRAMTEVLISSVLASGESVATGGSGLILPGSGDVPADLDVEDDWLS